MGCAQGCPVPGTDDWTRYRCRDSGDAYYHHAGSNTTTWEAPPGWQPLQQPLQQPPGGFPP